MLANDVAGLTDTQAFLVSRRAYGEADLICQALTRDYGKVSFIARSARGSRRRFAGSLDYYRLLSLDLHRGRGDLWSVRGSSSAIVFALTSDMLVTAIAAYGTELTGAFCADEEPEPGLFDGLGIFYQDLAAGGEPWLALVDLQKLVLSEAGLAPDYSHCVSCRSRLREGAARVRGGIGFACASCSSSPLESVDVIGLLSGEGRDVLGDTAHRAASLLGSMIIYHLGRHLKSIDFLKAVSEPT